MADAVVLADYQLGIWSFLMNEKEMHPYHSSHLDWCKSIVSAMMELIKGVI